MGVVRKYSCTCGYQEELCIGKGLHAYNKEFIYNMFPEAYKEQEEYEKNGQVRQLHAENIIATCYTCEKLYSIGYLECIFQNGEQRNYLKKCPVCHSECFVQIDPEHICCPKCNKPMTCQEIGHWD